MVEAPSPSHALTNCLIVSEADWAGVPYVLVKGQYVFTTKYVRSFGRFVPLGGTEGADERS